MTLELRKGPRFPCDELGSYSHMCIFKVYLKYREDFTITI